jgi:hypothetical protein
VRAAHPQPAPHTTITTSSLMGCWMGVVASCCVGVLNESQILSAPYFFF